jgi:Na+-translocating ferredoxin:NAD+ oxidoreductase RnfE subunit
VVVADLAAGLIALHLGGLHPYEKVLTLVLAFGPFIVLGVVIALRRRHEDEDTS